MIGRRAAVGVLVVLSALAAWRLPAVATTPPLADAHGERTWMAWSYRRVDADRHLAAVAARLQTRTCVAIVVGAGEDPSWWRPKALYHLRRQRVVAVRRAGEPLIAGAECLVLEQAPAGGFRIAGRPPA